MRTSPDEGTTVLRTRRDACSTTPAELGCLLLVALSLCWASAVSVSDARGRLADVRADTTTSAGATTTTPSRVLVIYSERADLPAVIEIDRGIRGVLAAHPDRAVELFSEYLDVARFPNAAQLARYSDSLRYRYADLKPDVVVAIGAPTLEFLVQHGAGVYPGTPVVVGAVEARHVLERPLPSGVTGAVMAVQTRATLELAFRLHPDIRRLVVVAGASSFDRYWAGETSRLARTLMPGLDVLDLGDRLLGGMVDAVATLPRHTVIFYAHVSRDAAGQRFIPLDALAPIAQAANAPIYGAYETYVGQGIVGGHVLRFEPIGMRAAQTALRIIGGEPATEIPVARDDSAAYVFDWRQLRRWGIDERRLPAGSAVRFREPTVWELYRWYIVAASGLVAIQSACIAGLLVQRSRRRRAERALAEGLRFEALLSELSAGLATAPTPALQTEIERALRRIVEELDLDRANLSEMSERHGAFRITASWARPGTEPAGPRAERLTFPWAYARLREQHVVRFSRPEELPPEARVDRASFAVMGTRSLVTIPVVLDGAIVAAVSFATVRSERQWPDDLVQRLRILEEPFAHALARRRAETVIRESEERFALLAESAPVMVWLAGPDGRRGYFNARWLEFTGRRLEDEQDDGWLAGVHPDNREACRQVLAAAHDERRPVTLEYRLRGSDGVSRWVLDHAEPRITLDGRFGGFVGSCIDVSELRAAQQAIAEADTLRSAIFDSLDGHVAALDRDGIIIAVNRMWMNIARGNGLDPQRVSIGADYLVVCRTASAMDEADGRRAVAMISGALDGTGGASRLEYACPTPSGLRWFEMSVEPLRRPEGGALVSHVDITRRREAEEVARRQAEDLAHVLRVGTLGDLAGSLAHEINQPLAAIVTNAQATIRLLEGAGAPVPDAVAALGDIAEDGKRASQVIRRLRALFRKEHATRDLVPINELIDQVWRLLEGELRRSGITTVVSLEPDLPPVLGDPVQLQQVLLNVLLNAVEAVAAVEAAPKEIRVATRHRESDLVEISMRDTGIGVGPPDLERIFERFFTSKIAGLGMGLPISRSIVQAHGGRIWAEQNDGPGITMRIELPLGGQGDPIVSASRRRALGGRDTIRPRGRP